MKKLILLVGTLSFTLLFITILFQSIGCSPITKVAPQEAVSKTETQVIAEVIKVEKEKESTLLEVNVNGKIYVYHVAKSAIQEIGALRCSEKVGLTVYNSVVVHVIKTDEIVKPKSHSYCLSPQSLPPKPTGFNPPLLPPPPAQ